MDLPRVLDIREPGVPLRGQIPRVGTRRPQRLDRNGTHRHTPGHHTVQAGRVAYSHVAHVLSFLW